MVSSSVVSSISKSLLPLSHLFRGNKCLQNANCLQIYHRNLPVHNLVRRMSNWHLVGALCVERKPAISSAMNRLEKDYWEMLQKIEVEKSLLSDHELRHKHDLEIAEKLKREEVDISDIEKGSNLTARDEEDKYQDEFSKFVSASRETNDIKTSMDRQLDKSLYLVIQQKLGKDSHWILPQAIRKDGETLRQTAERGFTETLGLDLNIRIMGNSPIGHYKYKYPKSARKDDNIFGAKVFFVKGQYIKGNITLDDSDKVKFMWLTKSELPKYLQKEYCKAVENFLIDNDSQSAEIEETDKEKSIVVRAAIVQK